MSRPESWGSSARAWRSDMLSLLAAAGLLGALAGLVYAFDGKPQNAWKGPFTPGAIVSVLTIAARGCILIAACNSISQWKWIYFAGEKRQLIDLEKVDWASRGLPGSLGLIFGDWTRGIIVRLGAFVVLFAVFLDPFSQQIFQIHDEVVFTWDSQNSYAAKVGAARNYQAGTVVETFKDSLGNGSALYQYDTMITLDMQSAILNGLSNSATGILQQAPYTCPTAECQWPEYNSLAVCSECNDVPASDITRLAGNATALYKAYTGSNSSAIQGNQSTAFRLPNGQFLVNIDGPLSPYSGYLYWADADPKTLSMSASGTGIPSKTLTLQHRNTLIWAVNILRIDQAPARNWTQYKWPQVPLVSKECGIYWCVNRYKSKVADKTYQETETELRAPRNDAAWTQNGKWTGDSEGSLQFRESVVVETPNPPTPGELNLCVPGSTGSIGCFGIGYSTVWAVNHFLQKLLSRNLTVASTLLGPNSGLLENQAHLLGGIFSPYEFEGVWNWDKQDLEATFRALALSMSNEVRAAVNDTPANAWMATESGSVGIGKTMPVFGMQWGWMALHGATILLGLIFLVLTITYSSVKSVPAYQSSALAVLARGLYAAEALDGAETIEDIRTKATGSKVMLIGNFGHGHIATPDTENIMLGDIRPMLRRSSSSIPEVEAH